MSTDAQLISVRTHPRARAAIRRMKGWAGMAGFVLTVLLSLRADVPMSVAIARGLIAGTTLVLVAWTLGVAVWRHLVVAELEAYKIEINRSHSPDDVR